MAKKYSLDYIICKIKEKHGDTVFIINETYICASKKATFVDVEYGKWECSVSQILRGHTNPKRADVKHRISLNEIKQKLTKAHGGLVGIIDSTYVKVTSSATFVDVEYGPFICSVRSVLGGTVHPKRGRENNKKKNTLSIDKIKQKLFKIHGSLIEIKDNTYKNTHTSCTFVDVEYGEWEATPGNVIRGTTHPERAIKNRTKTIENFYTEMPPKLVGVIEIKEHTFKGFSKKCIFIHKKYGEWETSPNSILMGVGHPLEAQEKSIITWQKNYGVDHPSKNKTIAMKMASGQANISIIKHHWKTGEELVCQSSYEVKVIDYLNKNQMDFLWQPEVFKIPIEFAKTEKGNPTTYRPDLFLINENKWIEIKGFMRPDALIKWNWFLNQFPTAELWDKKKLKSLGIL